MFIPIQAIPYARLVRRLFSGPVSLQSIAYRQDILCPEENETIRPAVFLPGQIEKVSASMRESTKEREIAAATSTTATHAPTIAYHIKDAVLLDGTIYARGYKQFIADKSLFVSSVSEPRHLTSSALASSYIGTKYFGHWLIDDCLTYRLAQQSSTPLCLRSPNPSWHQKQYEDYFDQDWTPTDRALIDHLIVFQDFAQNSLKRERYNALRHCIKTRFQREGTNAYVYLRRGKTGAIRVIQNEDEIIDALVKRGFLVLDVASDSLDKIIKTLLNAKIIVTLEGSHAAHCVYTTPENSGLLLLQSPDRFCNVYKGWTDCLNVRYGFVIGAAGKDGYYFSTSEILRTTDLMLNSIESQIVQM